MFHPGGGVAAAQLLAEAPLPRASPGGYSCRCLNFPHAQPLFEDPTHQAPPWPAATPSPVSARPRRPRPHHFRVRQSAAPLLQQLLRCKFPCGRRLPAGHPTWRGGKAVPPSRWTTCGTPSRSCWRYPAAATRGAAPPPWWVIPSPQAAAPGAGPRPISAVSTGKAEIQADSEILNPWRHAATVAVSG